MIHTCTVCGHSYATDTVPTTGHTWTDGVCNCGAYALQHVGATLTLESEVKYNLYFYLNDESIDISKVGLLTFLTLPENATIDNASYVLSDMFYDTRLGCNAMQTQGIPAKMMGDTLYLRLYAQLEDGTIVYGKVIEYSAKTYATYVLSNPGSTDLKNTLFWLSSSPMARPACPALLPTVLSSTAATRQHPPLRPRPCARS